MTAEELARDLSTPKAELMLARICRDAQTHSTPLFSNFVGLDGPQLRLAGSGTLLRKGQNCYVLTAAHVWHKMLRGATQIGLALPEQLEHTFFIDVEHISTYELPSKRDWTELGPDLLLFSIPEVQVGAIAAHRPFYAVGTPEKSITSVSGFHLFVVVGAPAALGTLTDTTADLQLLALMTSEPESHDGGSFDICDVKVDLRSQSVQSFGGLSGGGLWNILVYDVPGEDEARWRARLEGVAFFEKDVRNGAGTIRCHGRKSLEALLEMVP